MIVNSLLKYAKSGMENVSAEKKEDRMSICRACEHFREVTRQCTQCGCFLGIKTSWATEKCPLDKWGPEIIPVISLPAKPSGCNCSKK